MTRESGCDACWPDDADAAWAARATLAHEVLIDESHYVVVRLQCRTCGQRFLSVMTEQIDWADGEDPVVRTLIPLTATEAAALVADGAPTEAAIDAIGPGRRSLRYDFPKGVASPIVYWSTGIRVGPHD